MGYDKGEQFNFVYLQKNVFLSVYNFFEKNSV